MSSVIKKSGVIFKKLSPAYVGSAVDCVAASFLDDPFTKVAKLEPSDWAYISSMFIQRAATKDLSIVAVNKMTDRVEGVVVNEDWKEPTPEEYSVLSNKWRPVRAIFNKLHNEFKAQHPRQISKGVILHSLYFSCVRPEYRRAGIIGNLFTESLLLASDYHFDTVACEAASPAAWGTCEKFGFTEVNISLPFFFK